MKHQFLSFFIGLLLFASQLVAQDRLAHCLTFAPQFFQIKDSYNYGLVHDGLNLGLEYEMTNQLSNGEWHFVPQLAVGINYAQGFGLAFQFRPADLYRGWKINGLPITLGPYTSVNYQWQLYPELQSGHMFWFSNFELGPRAMIDLSVGQKRFVVDFSNSLFGLASRPGMMVGQEEYYYSLAFSDWVNNVHEGFRFGFNNLFNHTLLGVKMINEKKMTLGYSLKYFGYYQSPIIQYISHSITLSWKLKK